MLSCAVCPFILEFSTTENHCTGISGDLLRFGRFMILTQQTTFLSRALVVLIFISFCSFACGVAQAEDPSDTPSAFALFKEQAELGDVEAQYNLGVMCETGWSVPVDNEKAVRWLYAAAKQGHANAQLRLGMLHYLGIGSPQSNIKGEKWIRKAAKQGQPLADKLNKFLFADDLPDALSPESIISQVRGAYLENERNALFVLESLMRNAKQRAQRVEQEKEATTLRERRVQRSAEGPVKPGFAVATDVERVESAVPAFIGDASVEEDRTLARGSIATIRLQAEEGVASAQHNLGRMYELGIKLPMDKKRAMEWYEKAAQQGYADAEYRLGISLWYGAGAVRDEAKGKKWLALAASHGHPVAKSMVSEFENNNGASEQGISLAVRWYLERALMDDGQAAFHLGKIYQHGWGVRSDFAAAMKWYQQARQSGIKEAQALAEDMQKRLGEASSAVEPSQQSVLLKNYGLPVWLAHPAVIISVVLVVFSPVFYRRWRGRRNNIVSEG